MSYQEILDWSNEQEAWVQDALRRVVTATHHKVSDADANEVLECVKSAIGMVGQGAMPACIPLKADQLPKKTAEEQRRLLCSLESVKHVNRLAANQRLQFALDGITLIYGDNGSGKSGYSRILKKLCRTLMVDNLLGNVFDAGEKKPAEVVVRHKLDSQKEPAGEHWVDGSKAPAALANIAVFDTKAARLYVDQENQIQYLPPAISLMENYSELLKKLSEKVEVEVAAVEKRTAVPLPSGFAEGTAVSKIIQPIVASSAKGKRTAKNTLPLPAATALKAAAKWDEELEKQRKTLEDSLRDDPAVQAAKCRRLAVALGAISIEATSIVTALSDSKATELQKKTTDAKNAKTTAEMSATALFPAKDFLSQTGSEPWKRMYEYAKEYVQAAKGGAEEGVTVDNLCALCQQQLSPEAQTRLKAFESFIQDKANKEHIKAKKEIDEANKALSDFKVSSKGDIENRLAEYGAISEENKQLVSRVVSFIEKASHRRQSLLTAVEKGDFSKVEGLLDTPKTELDAKAAALVAEADGLTKKAEKDGNRDAEKKKLADLQDQKLLSQVLSTFEARLSDLALLENLNKCSASLGTTAASNLIGRLRRSLVTEDLQTRITGEIENFDLGHIPFVVKDKGSAGKSFVGVRLKAVAEVENREVLSEGEQRALALACFLGEVLGDSVKHGIVIDDPVSSLDHIRVRRVARRLVHEAAEGRQVVIFTHNLLFFSEVRTAAAEMSPQVPVLTHHIRKDETHGFGIVNENDMPWETKKVNLRIDFIRNKRLPHLKTLTDTGSDEYRRAVTDFYTHLREAWERFVEEVLLAGVVERFGSDVKTQSLKGVVVQDEDYQKVYFAMKRVSERSGHDTAAGKMAPIPMYDDMQTDLDELAAYYKEIDKRSKALQDERKKLEKPPAAKVA